MSDGKKTGWNFLRHSFFPLLSPDVTKAPGYPLPSAVVSPALRLEVRKSQEMRSEEFKSYLEQHLGKARVSMEGNRRLVSGLQPEDTPFISR